MDAGYYSSEINIIRDACSLNDICGWYDACSLNDICGWYRQG